MKKPKFGYGWLIKWILAAILLAIGITTYFNEGIVYFITGLFILIFSLFRIYPLLKTLSKEVLRTIHLVEVVLHTILGGLLLYVGIMSLKDASFLNDHAFWDYFFKYGIVFILASRAIVFFYSTTFLNEKVEQPKFWSHIAFLSIASIIAVYKDFSAQWVAIVLLVITILGSVYLVYDGFMGYGGYRQFAKELNEKKQAKEVNHIKEEEDIDKKEVPVTPTPKKEKEVPPPAPRPEIVPPKEKEVEIPEEKIIN